jgi:hypothetical protein
MDFREANEKEKAKAKETLKTKQATEKPIHSPTNDCATPFDGEIARVGRQTNEGIRNTALADEKVEDAKQRDTGMGGQGGVGSHVGASQECGAQNGSRSLTIEGIERAGEN